MLLYYAMGGGLDDADEIDLAVVLVVGVDATEDEFTGQGKGHKHDPAVHAGESLAEIGERINAQFQLLMIGEGVGDEFLGGTTHGAGKERRNGEVKSEKLPEVAAGVRRWEVETQRGVACQLPNFPTLLRAQRLS